MTDSDELISKADALLARWRSGAAVPRPPADYPVLTEVIAASAAVAGASLAMTADELLRPLEASPAYVDAGTQALEERVRLRVLDAIEPYIGALIEEPLRLRMEELSRNLATTIARDARDNIVALVRDAVRSAVAHELQSRRDEQSGSR
jgi:hypothetical protein